MGCKTLNVELNRWNKARMKIKFRKKAGGFRDAD